MKPPCQKPCRECPFKRTSARGWLGDDTPEGFMATTMADTEMPCHMTVDYEDKKNWRENLSNATQCAGAAIFFANIAKMSRDRSRGQLPRNKALVFSHPQEFVDHHTLKVKAKK